MGLAKVSFEESLGKDVVAAGKCVGCGTCVVVCPFNCLEYAEEKPRLVRECEVCGICAQTCPQYEWSWTRAEELVFGRVRRTEENFGVYRRLVIAQATDEGILKVCQDGGVVTALLTFALQGGLIDGAAVSGISRDKPFYPIPKLATTPKEVLECAGTRYSYSPNILALAEGVKQKKTSIALVGTPCQIRAIRKMQMIPLKEYTGSLKFTIGLMCTESFSYEGLMEKHIQKRLGVSTSSIRKMNIEGKVLVTTKSEAKEIPLAEAKQYARESCKFCDDFSSELADVSTGGLGLNGWTFTIIRTEKGEEVFSNAEKAGFVKTRSVDEEKNAPDLLIKLSKKKKQRSSVLNT